MRVVRVDGTQLDFMDSCWEKYNLAMIQRWKPNEKAPALETGDLIHQMAKHYYQEKQRGRWTLTPEVHGHVLLECALLARREGVKMELDHEDVEIAINSFCGHCRFWEADGLQVLAVEAPFSKLLYEQPDRPGVEGIQIIYEGIVDLYGAFPNQTPIVIDHKSESRKSTPSELSNQFTGYAWAFGIEEVIINKIGLQTSLEDKDKFRRIWLQYRDPAIIEEWKRDTIETILEAVERYKLDRWPRNRTSCDKYSGCIYKKVCRASPAVRANKLITYFHIGEPWSPYTKEHGKGEVPFKVLSELPTSGELKEEATKS